MIRPLSVDPYVIDTLLPDLVGHDRQPSAFLVYLYLWRHTIAIKKENVAVSLAAIAEETGLSKSAVQVAVKRLARRQLVSIRRDAPTATPVYQLHRPWLRLRH